MDYIFQLKNKKISVIIILILTSFYFFFWDIKLFGEYGFRELIILSSLLFIPNIIKNNFKFLRNNKNNLLIIFSVVSLIFLHQVYNAYIDGASYNRHNLLGILGLFFLSFFIFFYLDIIMDNLDLIIIFFLTILFFSYFFSPIERSTLWEIENLCSSDFQFKNTFIFLENSHFGMMIPSIFGYFIYKNKNKGLLFSFILFSILFLILQLEISSTLMFSFCLIFGLILFLDYKFFFKKNFIFLVIILAIFFYTHDNKRCVSKVTETSTGLNIAALDLQKKNFETKVESEQHKNQEDVVEINEQYIPKLGEEVGYKSVSKDKKYENFPVKRFNSKLSFNLSSSVFINAINISIETILSRPFGWGLNRYENAFDFYMFNYYVTPFLYHEVYTLNYNDASANLPKLFTEFGIFAFLLLPVLLLFLFTKKISTDKKIFFLGIVCTQLIRGAGYFNGGFLFSLIIILYIILNLKKNEE